MGEDDDHSGLITKLIGVKSDITIIASHFAGDYLKQGRHVNFTGAGYINGDAASNFLRFAGTKYCIISVNDLDEYYSSWDKILNRRVSQIYPSHGKSFPVKKLSDNLRKNKISNMAVWKT